MLPPPETSSTTQCLRLPKGALPGQKRRSSKSRMSILKQTSEAMVLSTQWRHDIMSRGWTKHYRQWW